MYWLGQSGEDAISSEHGNVITVGEIGVMLLNCGCNTTPTVAKGYLTLMVELQTQVATLDVGTVRALTSA